MSKIYIHSKDYEKGAESNYFSGIEIYALKNFHPSALFIDSIGLIWFSYYMWYHDWPLALGVIVLSKLLSILTVMDVDPQKMSETILGKASLLHLHPINFITQIAGVILLYYGVWNHSLEMILGGFSLILLGHLFGWSKVDSRLASHNQRNFNT